MKQRQSASIPPWMLQHVRLAVDAERRSWTWGLCSYTTVCVPFTRPTTPCAGAECAAATPRLRSEPRVASGWTPNRCV